MLPWPLCVSSSIPAAAIAAASINSGLGALPALMCPQAVAHRVGVAGLAALSVPHSHGMASDGK